MPKKRKLYSSLIACDEENMKVAVILHLK